MKFHAFFSHSGVEPRKSTYLSRKRPREEDEVEIISHTPFSSTADVPKHAEPPNNTVHIWDAATRQPVGELLQGHNSSVWPVSFPPNGSQIVSGSEDNTTKTWAPLQEVLTGAVAPGGYYSDETDTEDEGDEEDIGTTKKNAPSAPKRRCLDIPVRAMKANTKAANAQEQSEALADIKRLIVSKKTQWAAGHTGLQATRARAIESHLWMLVKNERTSIDAAQIAAEAHGFRPAWGGRQVRKWTRGWIADRKLPESLRGHHIKTWSLLEQPDVQEELKSYFRANKWSMDPAKLVEYTKASIVTAEMKKYIEDAVNNEMPAGLKRYLESEILPRNGMRAAHGISLTQARMTAQAHDGKKKGWVQNGEFPLRKKGAGRGIHRSDTICPCHGHITAAGQSMEYGKNYEGYWNGEMFVNQQLKERIIPAFEELHPPETHRALFFIDNSQGHAAYAEDALVVSRMNLRPGGKQAIMRDGWFLQDGQQIPHQMVMSGPDGSETAKGMKMILQELKRYLREHCDYSFEGLKARMTEALASVPLSTFRKWQNRTFRWVEAYRSGLDARHAQFEVKKFSTRVYRSHRRVGEQMGSLMDN
ncbi:hypothetical protein DL96DRAFT_1478969 [Flagelloscypha sp. PMI_526]|nr:hypothetical protein DL96DRAFT_1482912 [Flagelloscypha sp. PMI_526]KAH8797091.1 hypothetical protein DL96DRAFT_1478969 [Flagelloscypha sp. PMI_526]